MPIDTEFRFNQAHPSGVQVEAVADFLGLLRGLVGHEPAAQPQRTWRGAGFNMIWRPNFDSEFGTKDFFLELNFTDETLSFTDIGGATGVANRDCFSRGYSSARLRTFKRSMTASTTPDNILNPGSGLTYRKQPTPANPRPSRVWAPSRTARPSICRGRPSRSRRRNLRPPALLPSRLAVPTTGRRGSSTFLRRRLRRPARPVRTCPALPLSRKPSSRTRTFSCRKRSPIRRSSARPCFR